MVCIYMACDASGSTHDASSSVLLSGEYSVIILSGFVLNLEYMLKQYNIFMQCFTSQNKFTNLNRLLKT